MHPFPNARLLVVAACLAIVAMLAPQSARATPFADVPANHWAYQAIQTLAADGLIEGYPDGMFKGDRPITRYEMAVLIARAIAKVESMQPKNVASKTDLDKLQKLIDAFKDELDALGVRVTNLEDSVAALNARTKFAQSIEFHGFMQPDVTLRQRYTLPQTVAGGNGTAGNVAGSGVGSIVGAFISTDFSNAVYTQQGVQDQFRYDDKFTFVYHVNDNLTVSIPVHLMSYDTGASEFTGTLGSSGSPFSGNGTELGIDPGVDVTIAHTGNISNLWIKWGIQDSIKASRTGLTYRPPDLSDQVTFQEPVQAFEHGFSITGTLNGLTDFQAYWTREDPAMIDTQSVYPEGFNLSGPGSTYMFLVVPNQVGYSQNGYPGAGGTGTSTVSFKASNAPLTSVYLGTKALIGTVYVSQFNGTFYNSSGQIIGGGGTPAPGFIYDDALNAVTFTPTPLPVGSSVSITFVALSTQNYTLPQRFHVGARVNQKIKGLPGAEIGASYSRIWDLNDQQCSSNAGLPELCIAQTGSPSGYGLVSNTVFGMDAQVPLTFITGPNWQPVAFAEYAESKYSPNYLTTAPYTDTAWVAGMNLGLGHATATVQYQAVGLNFISGAAFRYYGNAPSTFAYWNLPYFPAFYGFANTVALNKQYDSYFAGTGVASTTATNPALSYITPMFNPFVAGGPQWFSSYTPNTEGITGNINFPIGRSGAIAGRLAGAHLSEIVPDSVAAMQYGSAYQSPVRETFDRLEGGVNFALPILRKSLAVGAGMAWDRLLRNDPTSFQYYPFNPATGGNDAASVGNATTAFGAAGSPMTWQPNYINVQHWTTNVTASMPVTKGVTLGGLYNQQTFGGNYQLTNQNMSETKTFTQGSLTYSLPNSPSSLTFFFRNMRYTDSVVPSYNFSENREDIIYAIRF